jgi:pimeloyl-ACP methyl ester carboxylesterase
LIDCLILIVERREEKMKKIGTTALLALLVVGLAIAAIPAREASSSTVSSNGWTLIAQRGLKAYPDLMETVWQKNAGAPPNGPYDIIGLHRVVKVGIQPVGVLFLCPGTWSSGEQPISNPPSDPWTSIENYSEPLYWANRGLDVYSIDYRTHFVPINLTSDQLSFMANWGWDQWISDIKEAIDKAKEVSEAEKIYMAGQSFGGIAAMNYASLYWNQDLKGLILLDPAALGMTDGVGAKNPSPTNSYNLTATIAQMNATGAWAVEANSGALLTFKYADQNPGAPAEYPPGTPLEPLLPWANITEWAITVISLAGPPWGTAGISNIYGGYGNATVVIHTLATFDRYWPTRLGLETTAYTDWINCPYITHDFDDLYSGIDVPLIAFQSQFFGNNTFGPFKDGIANPNFTATVLLGYGHLDVFSGVYSTTDVSAPTYHWMIGPTHDVAATYIVPSKTVVGQGYSLNVNVTPANLGGFTETFNVTVYANTTAIGTQTVFNLSSGALTTLVFTWNTTNCAIGNYAASALAEPVPNETSTADNNLTSWITVTILGDIDGNFKVNLADLVALAQAYASRPGDSNWNPNADIDGNGTVGLSDLVVLTQHYGQHYP